MKLCPCGSSKSYADCCEPYLRSQHHPSTPEALMRSRYTAYTLADIAYIQKTMRGKAFLGFNPQEAKRWAQRVLWLDLNVVATSLETTDKGYVEFVARFIDGDSLKVIHEKSEFIQENAQWSYVDGVQLATSTEILPQKIARNSACPCGSQKKFKNCHGR